MLKSVPLFIGLRYFFASSGNQLVSFISGLAVTGLVLGVALLIVVLSIMNGFDHELRTRILSLVSHVQLFQPSGMEQWRTAADKVHQQPGVVSVTPFSEVAGMLIYRGKVQPIVLHGELLGKGRGNDKLQQYLDLAEVEKIDNPLYLSGKIAGKLGIEPGQRLRMIVPAAAGYDGVGKAAAPAVFTVAGIFNTGTELDQSLAVTQLSVASKLAGFGSRVQGLQIEVADIFDAPQLRSNLRHSMQGEGFHGSDWTFRYSGLHQAIKGSRKLMLLLIFLIVSIAAFNVISMLVMTVTDKRPAIAILKTLGCSEKDILGIFLTKGSLIGLVGCLIGTGLGVLMASYVGEWAKWLEKQLGVQFLNTEVYPVEVLPSQLLWSDVATVVVVAFVLNLIATLYPAWKAGRVQPADELRYE